MFFFSKRFVSRSVHQSSGSSFRDCFVKTIKESYQPFWNHSIQTILISHSTVALSLVCRNDSRLRPTTVYMIQIQIQTDQATTGAVTLPATMSVMVERDGITAHLNAE